LGVYVKVTGGTFTLMVKLIVPSLLDPVDPVQVTSQIDKTDVVTGGTVTTVEVTLAADVVMTAPLTVIVVDQFSSYVIVSAGILIVVAVDNVIGGNTKVYLGWH
jgi:hypothetical protein